MVLYGWIYLNGKGSPQEIDSQASKNNNCSKWTVSGHSIHSHLRVGSGLVVRIQRRPEISQLALSLQGQIYQTQATFPAAPTYDIPTESLRNDLSQIPLHLNTSRYRCLVTIA